MNLNGDLYLNINSSCILVKGEKRGTINDLQRGKIELVPNELIDLLATYKNKRIKEVFENRYSNNDKNIINEYFNFLIEKEIIFFSEEKNIFISNNNKYQSPSKFLTAIIDLNKNSKYNIAEAVEKINKLDCENIQVRIYDYILKEKQLNYLLSIFKNTSFRNVEFLLMYDKNNRYNYQEIFNNYNRVNLVYFHSYDKKDKVENINSINYIYTMEKILSSDFCGFIMPFYFNISPSSYYLGEEFNTCLYKKISIDVDGNIKNCPSMKYDFGKIGSIELEDIIQTEKFKRFWNVTKNKISVCQSCEFRKVCTDCRAYLKEDELYEKPKYCDYDPKKLNW